MFQDMRHARVVGRRCPEPDIEDLVVVIIGKEQETGPADLVVHQIHAGIHFRHELCLDNFKAAFGRGLLCGFQIQILQCYNSFSVTRLFTHIPILS